MDRSLKAALLSGLVLPGAGQWWLGLRLRALLFSLPTLAGAWVLVSRAWELAMSINAEIASGRVAFDAVDIAARIHQRAAGGSAATDFAVAVLIVCWAGATFDAYWQGRAPR